MKDYGKELILDLHNCKPELFTRKHLKIFFKELCDVIDMERCKLTWWDDKYTLPWQKETEPHLVGTSAVQFIKTSNVTIHTLPLMKRVYINIFSCKYFDELVAKDYCRAYFYGKIIQAITVRRI